MGIPNPNVLYNIQNTTQSEFVATKPASLFFTTFLGPNTMNERNKLALTKKEVKLFFFNLFSFGEAVWYFVLVCVCVSNPLKVHVHVRVVTIIYTSYMCVSVIERL